MPQVLVCRSYFSKTPFTLNIPEEVYLFWACVWPGEYPVLVGTAEAGDTAQCVKEVLGTGQVLAASQEEAEGAVPDGPPRYGRSDLLHLGRLHVVVERVSSDGDHLVGLVEQGEDGGQRDVGGEKPPDGQQQGGQGQGASHWGHKLLWGGTAT